MSGHTVLSLSHWLSHCAAFFLHFSFYCTNSPFGILAKTSGTPSVIPCSAQISLHCWRRKHRQDTLVRKHHPTEQAAAALRNRLNKEDSVRAEMDYWKQLGSLNHRHTWQPCSLSLLLPLPQGNNESKKSKEEIAVLEDLYIEMDHFQITHFATGQGH